MPLRRNLIVSFISCALILQLGALTIAQDDCAAISVDEAIDTALTGLDTADPGHAIHELVLNLLLIVSDCDYPPDQAQLSQHVEYLLQHISLPELLAARRVGVNVAEIVEELSEMRGDPLRGLTLYHGSEPTFRGSMLTCATCHNGMIAPLTEGSYTRVLEQRLPALSGYTAEQYLVESLVLPEEYITPGYSNALMPQNLGDLLDLQDLADLIAYIESQDQELSE